MNVHITCRNGVLVRWKVRFGWDGNHVIVQMGTTLSVVGSWGEKTSTVRTSRLAVTIVNSFKFYTFESKSQKL